MDHQLFLLNHYVQQHPGLMKPVLLYIRPGVYEKIEVPLIVHVKAESNCFAIYQYNTEQPIVISKCLANIEALLPADFFIRIHRSDIINIFMVARFYPDDGLITLLNRQEVRIAEKRVSAFTRKFQFWMGRLHAVRGEEPPSFAGEEEQSRA